MSTRRIAPRVAAQRSALRCCIIHIYRRCHAHVYAQHARASTSSSYNAPLIHNAAANRCDLHIDDAMRSHIYVQRAMRARAHRHHLTMRHSIIHNAAANRCDLHIDDDMAHALAHLGTACDARARAHRHHLTMPPLILYSQCCGKSLRSTYRRCHALAHTVCTYSMRCCAREHIVIINYIMRHSHY